MAAIDFPSTPSIGDKYAAGSRMWRYNGVAWVAEPFTSPTDGAIDGGIPGVEPILVLNNGNPRSEFVGNSVVNAGSL